MFSTLFRSKTEVGNMYAMRRRNPFDPLMIAKVLEMKKGYVRYEAWQQGCNDMPRTEGSYSEGDFRFFYSDIYVGAE